MRRRPTKFWNSTEHRGALANMTDPDCRICAGTGVSEGSHGRTASCSCRVRPIAKVSHTAEHCIAHVTALSQAIAHQSGTASSELAGQIVSVLARDPSLIPRFMTDGSEMFLEGAFAPEKGLLSWYGQNGQIVTPEFMRSYLRDKQPSRSSGLDENH
jgi:hypothetical protein